MTDDRISAVLIPPQLERFKRECEVEDDQLEVVFSGWFKHVVLSSDRAFLFPRNEAAVKYLEREAAVLEALAPFGLPFMPRVVKRWHDLKISPYPFVATTRLPGVPFESIEPHLTATDVARFMTDVGQAIACWQGIDVSSLPHWLHEDTPRPGLLGRLLDERTVGEALGEAARILEGHLGGSSLAGFEADFRALALAEPVLVHGDLCGNQFLVDDELHATGVLDWGSAHIDHPLRDFVFGEWSTQLYEWEPQFELFREQIWNAYQHRRRLSVPDHRSVHALFTIAEACWIVSELHRARKPSAWQRKRYDNSIANLKTVLAQMSTQESGQHAV